ncbi:L-threonylcarbamoyladenylate synthase [Alkalibacterium olivapovliticus]|uniref:Threonylcarbamoyl-AMP synthase n=1 Tax=Alkalibacterium olivapovliticus TaxID=99907 RepID=A0A2T0W6H7_9LACT|nr:L-threonylcarbamoyladenylate synthase [Alkalibacterium olivapovliticus]PRY82104.1 L-threonylcarbamoyladenylate synthase [Alkalibacterium olivapovliticus]
MRTIKWQPSEIDEAADWLKKGEVVAFPTETVYGLGADATNESAVQKIYAAKGRPRDNPLIIHISSLSQMKEFVTEIPEKAELVMSHFWPGPCTIVLKKKGPLAQSVTNGLDTVGIRMPDHPVALSLIEKAGVPLAAPSANSSGKPSPTTAQHVINDLNGKISGVIDGGPTGVGLESTVLDLTDPKRPTILRPGGVSYEELTEVLGRVYIDGHLEDATQAPKSPGMKYRHYSPDKPVYILPVNGEQAAAIIEGLKNEGHQIGLLVSDQSLKFLRSKDTVVFSLGDKSKPSEAASRLYDGLRVLDQSEVTVILAEPYDSSGIGRAYMNRLEKAAEWLGQSL